MNSRVILLYSVFWMLFAPSCKAFSPGDTARASKPHNIISVFTESTFAPFNQWQKPSWTIDTTLHKLEVFTNQYNLGNTGSPYVPLVYHGEPNPLGFFYGNDYVSPSFYSDSNIRYYNTRAPYTQFFYVTDPKIHQFFHLCHTQNVGQKFNFALEFQRTRSDGVYLNQGTNLNQLTLSLNYRGKRYMAFANGMYDSYKLNQNGGIRGDSDFLDPNFSDRKTIPVNLLAARTSILEKSIHLKQYFFFGFGTGDSMRAKPLMFISHSFNASSRSNLFNDPGPLSSSVIYPGFFMDTSKTHDSLSYNEMTNDISIGTAQGWPSFIRWEVGVTNQWVHFKNGHTDSIFSNNIAHACIYNTGRFLYNVQGKEIVQGNNKGDYKASAEAGVMIDSSRSVRVKGEHAMQAPPLLNQLYYGNNFRWQNHFNKINTSTASLIYQDAKWRLNVILQASQVQNLVYFTTEAYPDQYTQPLQILSAGLVKDFTLGKWHLNLDETYQYATTDVPLRIPDFVSENSVFYENYLFHHHLLLRIGADVYYNTAYFADAYMPVTGQYYLQDQTKLGDYAYIDPFVSFRIKAFRMFFRLENAGAGLVEKNYFYAYALHYPMNDRVLHFGISWDFWN